MPFVLIWTRIIYGIFFLYQVFVSFLFTGLHRGYCHVTDDKLIQISWLVFLSMAVICSGLNVYLLSCEMRDDQNCSTHMNPVEFWP